VIWRILKYTLAAAVLLVGVTVAYFSYKLYFTSPLDGAPPIKGVVKEHVFPMDDIEARYGINEDIKLSIYLPPQYDGDRKLPVIYLLDGDSLFEGTAGYLSAMIEENPNHAAILIGVGYGYLNPYLAEMGMGRWRDYAIPGDKEFNVNPNAPGFLAFLTQHLVPYIKSNYKVDDSRSALFGHSMGGDMAFFSFLSFQPQKVDNPFTHFVIADGGNEAHFVERYMPEFEQRLASYATPLNQTLHVYFIWGGEVGEEGALEHIESLYRWTENLNYPGVKGYRYFPAGLDHGATMRTMAVEGLNLLLSPERRADYEHSHSRKIVE